MTTSPSATAGLAEGLAAAVVCPWSLTLESIGRTAVDFVALGDFAFEISEAEGEPALVSFDRTDLVARVSAMALGTDLVAASPAAASPAAPSPAGAAQPVSPVAVSDELAAFLRAPTQVDQDRAIELIADLPEGAALALATLEAHVTVRRVFAGDDLPYSEVVLLRSETAGTWVLTTEIDLGSPGISAMPRLQPMTDARLRRTLRNLLQGLDSPKADQAATPDSPLDSPEVDSGGASVEAN